MKQAMTIWVLLAACLLAAPAALAQDEVMFINSDALGAHQRPLVRFTHQKHVDVMTELAGDEETACRACHHDREVFGVQGDSTGSSCSDCHSPGGSADNPVPLQMAMHKQCKDCHRAMRDKGRATGPVMCGQCHVRGVKPPAK